MRVYRIENDHKRAYGWSGTLRPNRYGAFSSDLIPADLYMRVPTPWVDFGHGDWSSYQHDDAWFFAFPSLRYVKEFAQDIVGSVYLSVYEVEPIKVSEHQVVFHKASAKFISEQTIEQFRETLTCPEPVDAVRYSYTLQEA